MNLTGHVGGITTVAFDSNNMLDSSFFLTLSNFGGNTMGSVENSDTLKAG